MGLDCTSYKSVELVEKISLRELNKREFRHPLYERGDIILLFNYAKFEARGDGLEEGFYSFQGDYRFPVGPYRGYGTFYREVLAEVSGLSSNQINGSPETYKDVPFFEQIFFADNEGFWGPETCKTLLADYEQYRSKVRKLMKKKEFNWFESYEYFMAGLKFVGEKGVLRFH